MKQLTLIAKPISAIGLLLIIAAPSLFFTGVVQAGVMNSLLIAGTIAWFVSAPLWVKSE